jgi:hypothetical protein
MTGRKDIVATVLTGLAVLVYAASIQAWPVPLVGDSHRWAAAAILLLGVLACAQGTPGRGPATSLLMVLGVAAFGLGLAGIVTGSAAILAVLTADTVLLWAAATVRHALARGGAPLAT